MNDEKKAATNNDIAAESTPKKAPKSTKAKSAKAPKVEADDKRPYAIIRTGGKQYCVSPGDKIRVELIEGAVGSAVKFTEVLGGRSSPETAPLIGTPLLAGASVTAKVLGPVQDKKVTIYKKRRRKGYTKKQGHRQQHTEVLVESVSF